MFCVIIIISIILLEESVETESCIGLIFWIHRAKSDLEGKKLTKVSTDSLLHKAENNWRGP